LCNKFTDQWENHKFKYELLIIATLFDGNTVLVVYVSVDMVN